jgi:methionine-rich copper-binding protein CopC
VHRVDAVRLWFSGPVQAAVTTVRLADSLNQVVETAKPHAADGSSSAVVIAEVRGALRPGRYAVAWRTMSRDGHVESGHFGFRYTPAPAPPHR